MDGRHGYPRSGASRNKEGRGQISRIVCRTKTKAKTRQTIDTRTSLPQTITKLTSISETLAIGITEIEEIRLFVEGLQLDDDEAFFDQMSQRARLTQVRLHALLAALNLYMTGICPEQELIDVAFGDGTFITHALGEKLQRIHERLP